MSKRVLAAFLLLFLPLGLLAACGDDDDDAAPVASESEEESGGDAGGDSEDSGGGDGGGDLSKTRCAELVSEMSEAQAAASQALSGDTQSLEDSAAALEEFADDAPEEIRDDFQLIADGYSSIVRALADADIDLSGGQAPDPEALEELQRVAEELDTAEFQAASERVQKFFEEECGTGS